jgi:hypothetical protein
MFDAINYQVVRKSMEDQILFCMTALFHPGLHFHSLSMRDNVHSWK